MVAQPGGVTCFPFRVGEAFCLFDGVRSGGKANFLDDYVSAKDVVASFPYPAEAPFGERSDEPVTACDEGLCTRHASVLSCDHVSGSVTDDPLGPRLTRQWHKSGNGPAVIGKDERLTGGGYTPGEIAKNGPCTGDRELLSHTASLMKCHSDRKRRNAFR